MLAQSRCFWSLVSTLIANSVLLFSSYSSLPFNLPCLISTNHGVRLRSILCYVFIHPSTHPFIHSAFIFCQFMGLEWVSKTVVVIQQSWWMFFWWKGPCGDLWWWGLRRTWLASHLLWLDYWVGIKMGLYGWLWRDCERPCWAIWAFS